MIENSAPLTVSVPDFRRHLLFRCQVSDDICRLFFCFFFLFFFLVFFLTNYHLERSLYVELKD